MGIGQRHQEIQGPEDGQNLTKKTRELKYNKV